MKNLSYSGTFHKNREVQTALHEQLRRQKPDYHPDLLAVLIIGRPFSIAVALPNSNAQVLFRSPPCT